MSCRSLLLLPAASLVALLIYVPDSVIAGPPSPGDAVALPQANQCSSSGGECLSNDEPKNDVTLLQTKLQMNVLVDTQGAVMPEDLNLQDKLKALDKAAPLWLMDTEESLPIAARLKASFITATSGFAHAVGLAANLRQGALISIPIVLVMGILLAAHRAWPGSNVVGALILGSLYICASACMIETNKWLMLPGHFPFPLTLTTNHMLTSWLLAAALSRVCPSAFPALEKIEVTWSFCLKFVPIGAAFALSIVCGNAAYQSLSVPFLQVMKQCNIVIVYTFSVICGLEGLRRCSATLLFGTFCGTMLAVHGEMHFKLIGFVLQVVSSLSEATKVIIQGILMSGTCKLDPLTLVLFMAPACLLANAIPFLILEAPRSSEIITQLHLVLPMIIFNALLAFSLNVLVARCIKQLSAVGYLLCGIVKDITIIVSSSWFLGEALSAQQVIGFMVALSGVASYSLYKQNVDCFEDDHLLQGFSRVAERLFGQDKSKLNQEVASGDSRLPQSR